MKGHYMKQRSIFEEQERVERADRERHQAAMIKYCRRQNRLGGIFCYIPKEWPDNPYHGLCRHLGEDRPGERIYVQKLDSCPRTGWIPGL